MGAVVDGRPYDGADGEFNLVGSENDVAEVSGRNFVDVDLGEMRNQPTEMPRVA